jgi:hypothetical protein
MGLILALSNRIHLLLETVKTRLGGFMDWIARAQRDTPACHG